jgi:hypothetical protein
MKTFIVILMIAAFLQASFVGVNLCLILLLSRAFAADDSANLYMSFGAGVLLGILTSQNSGLLAIMYMIASKLMSMSHNIPFFSTQLMVIPYSFVLILLFSFAQSFLYQQSVDYILILIESLLVLPVFFLVKIWEENFNFKKDIKLKY